METKKNESDVMWYQRTIDNLEKRRDYAQFLKRYIPILNSVEERNEWEGAQFGTDGDEYDYIKNEPTYVWSIADNDNGNGFFLFAGDRPYKRYGYIVTVEPWEDDEEYFFIECSSD